MSVHLLKLCVGVDSVKHLKDLQAERLARSGAGGGEGRLVHITRNRPRRGDELIDGGSLYWVIKGIIRVRQRITAIESLEDDGQSRCALVLDPRLVQTIAKPWRPFQGWRYLAAADTPADLGADADTDEMPLEMQRELQRLGVL